MSENKKRRWGLIILAAVIILVIGGIVGFRIALGVLKTKVVETLGLNNEIREIRVAWSGVEVDGLRIKGTDNWPADDTLRADQVIIVPSLRSFFSGQYRISSITFKNPYVSVFRAKTGRVQVVPSLIHKENIQTQASESAVRARQVSIGHIMLKNGTAEFYDASVGTHMVKITFAQIQADIKDIIAPTLNAKSQFNMEAIVKGDRNEGRLDIQGWADLSTKDSSISLMLSSVDMVPLQPYLLKAKDTRVQKGVLDLDLKSEVRNKWLKAPGRITISNLTLAPSKGFMGTFMGVPRDAVLAMLKDKENRITLDFVLEGDLGNPKFTIHEALSQRMALSMAEFLKVSIGGVAKSAGELGEKGAEAAGGVVKGVGDTVQQILGGPKKK
jgi:hypothetical protein